MFDSLTQEPFLQELRQKPDRKYRVGAVSSLLGVKVHVIRYWEKEFGTFIKPEKTAGGHSLYSLRDVELLSLIRKLLHSEKYSISGARKKIREIQRAGVPESVPRDLLFIIREEVEDIIKDLKEKKAYLDKIHKS